MKSRRRTWKGCCTLPPTCRGALPSLILGLLWSGAAANAFPTVAVLGTESRELHAACGQRNLFGAPSRDPDCADWISDLDGPAHGIDFAFDLSVGAGGRVFSAGQTVDRPCCYVGPGGASGIMGDWVDAILVAHDGARGSIDWSTTLNRTQDGFGQDEWLGVAANPLIGVVVVTGFTTSASALESSGTGTDVTTAAFDAATGELRWVSTFSRARAELELGTDIVLSPDGRHVFVTGSVLEPMGPKTYGRHLTVLSYATDTGVLDWSWVSGPGVLSHGVRLAVDEAGTQVVAVGCAGHPECDAFAVSLDATTGAEDWNWASAQDGEDDAIGIAIGRDGPTLFITGSVATPRGDTDVRIVALHAESGIVAWTRDHDGPAGSFDRAGSIAASPDGGLVVISAAAATAPLVLFGAASLVKEVIETSSFTSALQQLALAYDLATWFAGVDPEDPRSDVVTAALDADSGQSVWTSLYHDHRGGANRPVALAFSGDGERVIVAGQTGPRLPCLQTQFSFSGDFCTTSRVDCLPVSSPPCQGGGANFLLLGYDSETGSERWIQTFAGSANANGAPSSVAVGTRNRMAYVAGGMWQGADQSGNLMTLAYEVR